MISVGYAEARSALAAAGRDRRLSASTLEAAKADLEARWNELYVVALDEQLVRAAGAAAEEFALRALDALHLASALWLRDPELVVATWDDRLRAAAQRAGLAIAPA